MDLAGLAFVDQEKHGAAQGFSTAELGVWVMAPTAEVDTRQKSAEMVAAYIRETDKWSKSDLKGVGF